jgi:hypothetical protein
MLRKLELLQSVPAARLSSLAATKPGQVLQPLIGLIYFKPWIAKLLPQVA